MLAVISSHAPIGMEGELVSVEVDIRKALPGIDVVGLPDGAVRESRDRVRVAIKNSGFNFPQDRVLVSLAPAAVRKEGASFDLPIALGILAATGQLSPDGCRRTMVLGELNLGGGVRPVRGVLSAVGAGLQAGISRFLVPKENLREALALGQGSVTGISSLREAAKALVDPSIRSASLQPAETPAEGMPPPGRLSDIRGHPVLKRALEIAAAGRHHLLLFGPPGAGKTMAARRLPVLLPALDREDALAVTRIHSIAGVLPPDSGLVTRPPFRMPHHSASPEGILGGGRHLKPGEVSLAHNGVLFLDESPEFGMSLLQGLREPVEDGWVSIARAGCTVRYPAEIQLVLAFNPCPCGNLGRGREVCVCGLVEVQRYWRRVGGALMDRIDIRVPLEAVAPAELCTEPNLAEEARTLQRIARAVRIQRERHAGLGFTWNARMPGQAMDYFCELDAAGRMRLLKEADTLHLSSRAFHSLQRIARTIADLEGDERVKEDHVAAAVEHRRYGDGDFFWIKGRVPNS
ncbi:MAG TPA: YifB family Mg chelatase-like AAA ATPase [Spirochaetia bacterium]|nr:YifB family Mg chelatase-like AAA ATPase [Spirochaetia bacterium]